VTQDHKHPNYMAIFYTLAGLTAVELVLAMTLQQWKGALIVTLVALAFIKAGLVAAFFMHLKFEMRTFVVIVCFPLILAAVLVLGLMPDVGYMGHGGQGDQAAAPPAAPAEHK
jgi:caa(3)-type oxidase subunit IV